MYHPTTIKPSPGAEEAGRSFREAMALAESGRFDEAACAAEAVEEIKYRLSFVFKNEALLGIVVLCCEAGQAEKASEMAGRMDASGHRSRAFEIVESCKEKHATRID